jgi:Raf kinase inhibitor-like YbhB/YbcL family protein
MKDRLITLTLVFVSFSILLAAGLAQAAPKKRKGMQFASSSFQDGGSIPAKFTCKGDNVSPELKWNKPPAGTKYFAVLCEDPDAPMKTWIHWVIYDIPAKMDRLDNTFQLLEGFPRAEKMTNGILQGINDFGRIGWDGPCPPSGIHRYYFKLYALDAPTGLKAGANKEQLLRAIKGHVLSETQIMGTFQIK